MLQTRLRPLTVCTSCRSLLSSRSRSYATAQSAEKTGTQPPPYQASTSTADVTTFTPAAAPMRKKGGFQMKTYKPRTPGLRHLKRAINDHLHKGGPMRNLTFAKVGHAKGGRNNSGRVTVRHRGGGHRRRIRTVDFNRKAPGKHLVERIEYDPNRSAHLALLQNLETKKYSYIIAAEGMRAGDTVESFRSGIPQELLDSMGGVLDPGMLAAKTAFRGNCLPVKMIPLGTQIYCVGSAPERGAVFCRSAGTYATVISKTEVGKQKEVKDVTVRLQSNEIRKVAANACATIGTVSNPHHHFEQLGKAGRSRWLNIRPTVRGVAMNAADHPHGGGRGKSKGNVHPVSIWGRTPAKGGYKTRKKRNPNIYVVKERPRNQGKRRAKN
ncbi:related to mitochondrial ribosomal L2 of the large subunit [Lecanosticta acicola]|uniref:Large ribosomal subunit protein uL2m n=1 Tax=Lecanosticta acicola TaxID=111012 RepID=A0AAI8Z454_9PEZI|nr:related to mitochondrial ribosomal L2 of the large subunit [Lecanosticta acicola]